MRALHKAVRRVYAMYSPIAVLAESGMFPALALAAAQCRVGGEPIH